MSDIFAEPCEPVLLNTFLIHRKKCRVYFHKGILTWEVEGSSYARTSLQLADALAVHYVHGVDDTQCCSEQKSHTSFTVHYAVRSTKNRWRYQTITLTHTDPRQVASWVKTLRNYLLGLSWRPKRILFFVNPYGGKKKGVKIYEKKVKPLLILAGVETEVITTQRQHHARETLLTHPLDGFDAVACVGGDGTFAEVFNGLVLRTIKDAGIDSNDSEVCLPHPTLRLGVIPGGSTDTMAYCFHGTTDVQTAAIHIVLGRSVGLDLCSVHSNGNLLHFYSSVISYGFLGDVLKESEKFRWMGPKRYEYSGFKKFVANKGYECEITFLPDSCSAKVGPKCQENCQRCYNKEEKDFQMTEWKTIRGKYFMINGANVSCACSRSPQGLSPYCHLGDGCVDVILIKHSNLFNNFRVLLRMKSKANTVFELPFVEIHRSREFIFRALPDSSTSPECPPRWNPSTSVWNCDGEIQLETNIKVRAHCQLVQVFGRGFPEFEEEPSCKSCSS